MKKEEALLHFQENYVKEKSQEKLLALEQYFQHHKDELVPGVVESFRQICLKIKKMQLTKEKAKIGYITYSMLRTKIVAKRSIHLMEAFDNTWFFDPRECQAEYDSSWAFRFLEEMETELEEQRKGYINLITKADLERLKLKEASKYNQYIIKLVRYAMPRALVLQEFREMEKEAELEIRVGEYRDLSEIVHKEDTRVKDSAEIKELLRRKSPTQYIYEVFKNLDLSEGDYEGIDFRYADLSGSSFSQSNMQNSILLGTKFNECNLERANFSQALIQEADFSNSNLKEAEFYQAVGSASRTDQLGWEIPGFLAVNFQGADLEGANFVNADLKGANFKSANLKAVNFKGANLEEATFSQEAADLLNFDEQQKKAVKWN